MTLACGLISPERYFQLPLYDADQRERALASRLCPDDTSRDIQATTHRVPYHGVRSKREGDYCFPLAPGQISNVVSKHASPENRLLILEIDSNYTLSTLSFAVDDGVYYNLHTKSLKHDPCSRSAEVTISRRESYYQTIKSEEPSHRDPERLIAAASNEKQALGASRTSCQLLWLPMANDRGHTLDKPYYIPQSYILSTKVSDAQLDVLEPIDDASPYRCHHRAYPPHAAQKIEFMTHTFDGHAVHKGAQFPATLKKRPR
ncbi:hypothetical protein ACRALDRAFT_209470 [Sodiomyces alcalophilus JCM 7366]|uniref:uncharacterized protein n=1 Tax=Sodiomyces alcalophilus JCM 7366 TaxID=591952 RepID=UPI0039B55C31